MYSLRNSVIRLTSAVSNPQSYNLVQSLEFDRNIDGLKIFYAFYHLFNDKTERDSGHVFILTQ